MAKKVKRNIGNQILGWILFIAMILSVFATGFFVIFGK